MEQLLFGANADICTSLLMDGIGVSIVMSDPDKTAAERPQTACAHLRVSYAPIDVGKERVESTEQAPGGERHIILECWTCDTCRHQFIPFGKHRSLLTTTLRAEREELLVMFYEFNPVEVAKLCDETLDKSGEYLGAFESKLPSGHAEGREND